MEIAVYFDPSAIRFVRSVARVPGKELNAGGAGYTLGQSIARLESEIAERKFQLNELAPAGVEPIGIAAHFSECEARAHALQEVVETLFIQDVHHRGCMGCVFHLSLFGTSIGVARTSRGYFALIRSKHSGEFIAAHSAGKTLRSTVTKAWEEFRSIKFFAPTGSALRTFTRANSIFGRGKISVS